MQSRRSEFINRFLVDLNIFVSHMYDELAGLDLIKDLTEIDHVCYRVADLERYEFLKKEIANIGSLLAETPVNGRPIATFRLNVPIQVNPQCVLDVVEIPAPKPGRFYTEGFEHVEAVTKQSLDEFMKRHPTLPFLLEQLHLPFNREISLKGKHGLMKFHELSLAEVIKLERVSG